MVGWSMDVEQAKRFMGDHHRAVIAVTRSDGRPQMSPVMVAMDGEGRVVISSRESAYKVKTLRRDPKVSLCVLSDEFYGSWIQVEGTATIVSLPEAMGPLVDYYRAVAGEHPDWDDYRAAMERERRVIVRIEVQKAGPDRQG